MNEWIEELSDLTAAGEASVLVTISGIRGSTPRETGAKLIVTARETIGTIGGGQLEHQCTHIAAGPYDHQMFKGDWLLYRSIEESPDGNVQTKFEGLFQPNE